MRPEWGCPSLVALRHRAILGSLERFIAILIEHHAGAFPMWLAPEQVRVIPIATRHDGYAEKVADRLGEAGLRVEVDESRETLGKKVRAAQLDKVPYALVVGDKEEEAGTVAVRDRDGVELRGVTLGSFITSVVRERNRRELQSKVAGLQVELIG
jgi:threonyl-tRNA synthetase